MAPTASVCTPFSRNASKAYFEAISLAWAPVSLVVLLVGVLGVGSSYAHDRYSYLVVSVALCVPGFAIPLLYPCSADAHVPMSQRFWVKAAVWLAIFSFYGNYFWTHYFYQLLGARYLFDAHRLNDVPLVCFLCTYFYFTFYFALVNVLLRFVRRRSRALRAWLRFTLWWGVIAALSYGTAVFEAVSIQHFPLYTYSDKQRFVTVGSVVYALYFVVGFPMFFDLDEPHDDDSTRTNKYTMWQVAQSALAATAIVTLLLDIWRLVLGNIYALGSGHVPPVPFIYQRARTGMLQRLRERASDASVMLKYNGRAMIRRGVESLHAVARRWQVFAPQHDRVVVVW